MSTGENEGVHFEFYFTNPILLQTDEYQLTINSRPYKTSSPQSDTLLVFDYTVKIIKYPLLKFSVFDSSGNAITALEIEVSTFSPNKFIYYSLTISVGFLYFESPTTVRSKVYILAHAFQDDVFLGFREKRIYEETSSTEQALNTVIPYSATNPNPHATGRWNQVVLTTNPTTQNLIGLRVLKVSKTRGAFPMYLIASTSTSIHSAHKCYFYTERSDKCNALALLSTSVDESDIFLSDSNTVVQLSADSMTNCRLGIWWNRCLLPKPGYLVDLMLTYRSPLPPFDTISIDDFNLWDQKDKDLVYMFTNAAGTKYLASCPMSCK